MIDWQVDEAATATLRGQRCAPQRGSPGGMIDRGPRFILEMLKRDAETKGA